MNELRKGTKLEVEKLDKGHFFESLIETMMQKKLLQAETLQSIQFQLLNLLTEQIESYTKGKSSSIPRKQAEQLMQSIYFTLGFYFKQLEDLDESIALLEGRPVKEMFKEGQSRIKEAVSKAAKDLQQLKDHLLPTLNIAYQYTYQEGLGLFFKGYDPEFMSHENPGDIDYPLSIDDMKELGIDYMTSYLKKSFWEDSLCQKFNSREIEVLLENYERGYEHLLINIYEIVLTNALGHKLLNEKLDRLLLDERDVTWLQQILENSSDIDSLLHQNAVEVLEQLGLGSEEMKGYVKMTIEKLLPPIKLLLQENRLTEIFIIGKEKELEINYTGGEKLSDEHFKVLTEEIRSCEHLEDKIKYIREEVTHVGDIKDILEAECLFGDEYKKFYETLNETEIALLVRGELADEFGETYLMEEEQKEWKIKLMAYLNEKNEEKRNNIINLAKHIRGV